MGATALGARQSGTNNRVGGNKHRAQFERVVQIEIELRRGADSKTRQIFLAHLVNAR